MGISLQSRRLGKGAREINKATYLGFRYGECLGVLVLGAPLLFSRTKLGSALEALCVGTGADLAIVSEVLLCVNMVPGKGTRFKIVTHRKVSWMGLEGHLLLRDSRMH